MKYVLVDLSTLGRFSGFAEVCENYGRCLAAAEIPGIQLVYLVPPQFVGTFGSKVKYVSTKRLLIDLGRLGHKIDLWHSTNQLYKICPPRRRDLITLMTVHDIIFLRSKKGIHWVKHYFLFWLRLLRSSHLVVISDYVKQDLTRHFRLGKKGLDVIYNGVKPLENYPSRKPVFAKEGEKFFLAVGQVAPRKNYESLVRMMALFPDYKLYICGVCDNKYARKFYRMVSTSPLKDRVILAGGVQEEEKCWLFANCEAFMMSSLHEGFGLPVVEAMRFGKPVFCANATSLPEVGSKYAYYWNDWAPESMAQVVRDGLKDFDEERRAAEMQHAKKFDYQKYTEEYIDLYKRLLNI